MHFCTHLQIKGMLAKCSDSNSCKSTIVYKEICNVYEFRRFRSDQAASLRSALAILNAALEKFRSASHDSRTKQSVSQAMFTPVMLQAHITMMIVLMTNALLPAIMTVMVLPAANWAIALKNVLWIPIPEVRIRLISGGSVAAPPQSTCGPPDAQQGCMAAHSALILRRGG